MAWDEKMKAAGVSVASNTTLVLSKFIIGSITGSVSIISEAVHSCLDLIAAIIAFFSVREVRKPADHEHPFGHGKVENVSGTIEALLILFASVFIIHEAIGKILQGGEVEQLGLGVIVMGVSTLVNTGVSIYLFKIARMTGSLALEADAEHLRTDVYTSLGVMMALILIHITKITLIDPIMAIIVALYIAFVAVNLTRKAYRDLVDSRLSEEEEAAIHESVEKMPGVIGYHKIRTRRSGKDRFIDFHILVPDSMDVKDSHDLTQYIEKAIIEKLSHASITIHVEPCSGGCDGCSETCTAEQKNARQKKNILLPGEEELNSQVREILSRIEGVIGTDDIHIHRLGGQWEIHIDLIVPGNYMVSDGHTTAQQVEEALRETRRDLGKVTIHVEQEGHVDATK
jgi:cation diffusion facilitator family transporter